MSSSATPRPCRLILTAVLSMAPALCTVAAQSSDTPLPENAALAAAARAEGALTVYSVTSAVPALLDDFRKRYPYIALDYQAMDTTPLYQRVISESAQQARADVAWSSAMDLQIKLVADGYALTYESPETDALPTWSVWRNQAYGTSYEPVGIVYNTDLLDAALVPQTRADFISLLRADRGTFRNRIIAFDPEKVGLGFFLMAQDSGVSSNGFWNLAAAMAATGLQAGTGSGMMFESIGSGKTLIGYNLLGSYALGRSRKDIPNLGLVLPQDYTLVMSRVMFILKNAPHPNAAKLWLDYVLSQRGQQLIADSGLGSLRDDVDGEFTRATLDRLLGDSIHPIAIDAGVLSWFDEASRQNFLDQWRSLVRSANRPAP